ncbi:hypothetical protein D3C86_2263680 [compost metagenome]
MGDSVHCPAVLLVQGNSLPPLIFGLLIIASFFQTKCIHAFDKAKAWNTVIPVR